MRSRRVALTLLVLCEERVRPRRQSPRSSSCTAHLRDCNVRSQRVDCRCFKKTLFGSLPFRIRLRHSARRPSRRRKRPSSDAAGRAQSWSSATPYGGAVDHWGAAAGNPNVKALVLTSPRSRRTAQRAGRCPSTQLPGASALPLTPRAEDAAGFPLRRYGEVLRNVRRLLDLTAIGLVRVAAAHAETGPATA
jgi:hypothetical protein